MFFVLFLNLKRISVTTALLFWIVFAYTQNLDSLKSVLSTHPNDTDKLIVYQELLKKLVFSNPEDAIFYGSLMLDLARRLDVPKKQQKANIYKYALTCSVFVYK